MAATTGGNALKILFKIHKIINEQFKGVSGIKCRREVSFHAWRLKRNFAVKFPTLH